jgi:hypothetical protein
MQRKQDYKRWTFRSGVSAFAFLCFPLVLRWVFVCGFSAFVLHHYFLSSRYHVFSGLVSFQSTISFRRTWSLNDPACDAVQTNAMSLFWHIRSFSDWIGMTRPSALVEPSLPSHGWADGRELPAASPDPLAMIAIRSPQLAYHSGI